MPGPSSKPKALQHCVAAVAKEYGGDTSRAFAICTAQLQKSGDLKPGTQEPTAKGKERDKMHAKEPGDAAKSAEYEKALKKSKKESFHAAVGKLRSFLAEAGGEDLGVYDITYNGGGKWAVSVNQVLAVKLQKELAKSFAKANKSDHGALVTFYVTEKASQAAKAAFEKWGVKPRAHDPWDAMSS